MREYKNDFLFMSIQPAPGHGPTAILLCLAISLSRFAALCKDSFGICSNPAFRGLQLLRADVSDFARKRDVITRDAGKLTCEGIIPVGQGWYGDRLIIENPDEKFLKELLSFSVLALLRRVLSVCRPEAKLPGEAPDPASLQRYLESL